jgi:hypothetical protein
MRFWNICSIVACFLSVLYSLLFWVIDDMEASAGAAWAAGSVACCAMDKINRSEAARRAIDAARYFAGNSPTR